MSLFRDQRHGPLPGLLLALTVVTGLVDAVSILSLGRVFVANMTGNIVFVGFALAGAKGFSLAASLAALGGFLVGAGGGGRLVARLRSHRGRLLLAGSALELAFVGAGLVILVLSPPHPSTPGRDAVAGVVAIALGVQNAVVRSLAVPDLTTTVLTLTLTGLVADVRRGLGAAERRRGLGVLTMFAGAVAGAELVLQVAPSAALGLAAAILAGVVLAAGSASAGDKAWHRPP